MPGRTQLLRVAVVLYLCCARPAGSAEPPLPVLHHIPDVKLLDNVQASRHYPIGGEAQYTGTDYYGAFLEESGQGVYAIVPPLLYTEGRFGDWIQFSGVTDAGGFGPVIRVTGCRILRHGTLPPARDLTRTDLLDPNLENFRARARGKINRVWGSDSEDMKIATVMVEGVELAVAVLAKGDRTGSEQLLDAEVEIEGIYGSLSGGHGERAGGVIFVQNISQVRVVRPPPPADWSVPLADLDHILGYRSAVRDKDRVRLRGVITRNLGDQAILQSAGGRAVQLELARPESVSIGSTYEALGVIEKAGSKHMIVRQARLRPSAVAVTIDIRTLDEITLGFRNYGDSLVRVIGKVAASARISGNYAGTVEVGHVRLISVVPVSASPGANPFVVGSVIESTGVAQFIGDDWSGIEELRLLNRSGADIRLVRAPPWTETFPFALVAAGGLVMVLIALLWIWILRRTVQRRTELLEQRTAALEKAKADAIQATKAKSMFLANMSHEIRTPLNGVLGMNQLLLESKLDAQQLEWAKALDESGRRLLGLLNDVLDISKVESGQMRIESVPFSISQLISEVKVLHNRAAQQKGVTLTSEVGPDVPEALLGDPMRIRQIVGNYVSNGIKFTAAGSVTIRAAWDADMSLLRISVKDTGIGFTAEQSLRMFQRFEQADSTTTRRFGGTGLGLAICRQLAKAMGGGTWCTSVQGEGSEFWLELPAARSPQPVPRIVRHEDAKLRYGQLLCEGRRILVAEDNAVNQRVIVHMLESLGARVDLADNGRAALEKFRAERYDLVLLDCHMPEMDGYQAASQIRDLERRLHRDRTPLLAFTASLITAEVDLCLASGMDAVLGKPVLSEELRKLLIEWLPSREIRPLPEQNTAKAM